MSAAHQEFCVVCGDDRPIRHERRQVEYDVRGEKVVLDLPVAVCESCDTSLVEGDLDPPAMAFAEYRRRKGLLTPGQVKEVQSDVLLRGVRGCVQ